MENTDLKINLMKENCLPHPPQSEEQEFYQMVVNGDVAGIEQLRQKYSKCANEENEKGRLSPDPVHNEIYHLVANCTIITRKCIAAGMPQEDAFYLSDMFIRRADSCHSVEEVQRINDEMAIEFAGRMNRFRKLNGHSYSKGVIFAVRYISDSLHTKLTADIIAQKAGYERSYFSDMFRRETGVTLSRYILEQKINAAKSMISGGVELSRISEMLGFSSQSHFCNRFKSLTGMTPSEYRNCPEAYRDTSTETDK